LPVLFATWIFAPPQAGEKDERRFEKSNLCSRVPRLRFHVVVFWSRAKSLAVLGGTLGENAAWYIGHGSSSQADGCGLSPAAGPAWHVVLCGHRIVFSSPPGRRMFHLLAFFHEPMLSLDISGAFWHVPFHKDTAHYLSFHFALPEFVRCVGCLLEPVPLQLGGYWVTAANGSRYQVIECSSTVLPFEYTNSPFLWTKVIKTLVKAL
jgi:hypothetical protein